MHNNLPNPGGGKMAKWQDDVRNVEDVLHPALAQTADVLIKVY
jgi:hypothetical protein